MNIRFSLKQPYGDIKQVIEILGPKLKEEVVARNTDLEIIFLEGMVEAI